MDFETLDALSALNVVNLLIEFQLPLHKPLLEIIADYVSIIPRFMYKQEVVSYFGVCCTLIIIPFTVIEKILILDVPKDSMVMSILDDPYWNTVAYPLQIHRSEEISFTQAESMAAFRLCKSFLIENELIHPRIEIKENLLLEKSRGKYKTHDLPSDKWEHNVPTWICDQLKVEIV